MTFVIVGGGRVGLRATRVLSEQGSGVVIVEQDPEKARRARDEGFRGIEGDGADSDVLEEAGISTAEAIAGLTGDLNTSFAACKLGAVFGCRTVLRIDEDYRKSIYEKYADEVVEITDPEQLGVGPKTALLGGNFNLLADLTEELQLFDVKVQPGAPAEGEFLSDLDGLIDIENARVYGTGVPVSR